MSLILSNRVRNHIDSTVKDHLYLDDTKGDDGKLYSRGLAAICMCGLAGTPYNSVTRYVVDGPADNGIDGIFYDSPRNRLYVVQAKWSHKGTGTLEVGDLRKFIAGVYNLLNEDWHEFNDRVKAISKEISTAIKNDPAIILVAAFNSDNNLSPDCKKVICKFLTENNTDAQDVVSFAEFDLKRILQTIKSVKSGARTDVELNLLNWGEQKYPYYAIYGKVSCADVAEWHLAHDTLLFTENIRNTLPESPINIQIEETLLKRPGDFWYLNNGVTAIAESVARKPVGLGDQKDSSYWNVGNLKIVNGAQTTGSIAKAYARDKKSVRKAYVQIKIISLKDAPIDISNRITTATNTQNEVTPKDFLALEPAQDGLAEGLRREGIQYCFRRGEKVADLSKGFDVQELALALAVSDVSMTSVTIAKRNVGSLTDPNGYYSKLFEKPPTAKSAWEVVQRWRKASRSVAQLAGSVLT